ncbi:uncharacterized protein TRAVEDRAFT_22130 [Trametes versicolor FP-101664 SS1]|uniref:uncharacterized protein n=1 Tax=Trametes versicolor (strain FP-101664) TaxID=717944 RepID=UPI00046219A7|nr:uncharacterized protein TRAVEDRAFT_22130 [Trametes versicolor FP-101664 SS1]EIW55639.1 hypothetical protein TRAVEDRAFT_22130 [Trametes versicolor FP-101664 SS1]
MQSHLIHTPASNQRHLSSAADGGRRLSSARSFDASGLGYVDSYGIHQRSDHSHIPRSGVNHGSFTNSAAVQSSYRVQEYTENPAYPSSTTPSPQLTAIDWQSPRPMTVMPPGTPNVNFAGTLPTSRGATHARNGHFNGHSGYNGYDHTRPPLSPIYHTPAHSENYGSPFGGAPTQSFADPGYTGSHPASFAYAMQPVHNTRVRETPRCEWANCRMPIDDSSPAGIARHLKQHHDVQVADNRSRHPCRWGAQPCGKDMYPSSLGKHIAECHLRNMVKQCPHCGADFARADTLSRHIKAFCPNSNA